MKPILAMAATAVAASLITSASASTAQAGDWQGGFGHMMWGGGFGMFGGIMMLVFWGLIIALIVMAVRWYNDSPKRQSDSNALTILRARFAKGEIDAAEFEVRRKALES